MTMVMYKVCFGNINKIYIKVNCLLMILTYVFHDKGIGLSPFDNDNDNLVKYMLKVKGNLCVKITMQNR